LPGNSTDRHNPGIHIEATGRTAGAVRALARLEQAAAQSWWGLHNLGLAFAALPAAVGAGTAAAVKWAAEWEKGMKGVARAADLQGKALDDLENSLKSIARIKPISPGEILGVAQLAGQLGVEGERAISRFTSVVTDLVAISEDLTFDQAGRSIARIAASAEVGAEGFDNIASAIAKAGIATAASEGEISKLATDLAGIGATFGFSADKIIGWAAALRSAGVPAERARTAVLKTAFDISTAVGEAGDEIELFAEVAGMSVSKFSDLFRRDASAAMTQFVVGLGDLQDSASGAEQVLAQLGITEARQSQTLLQLATMQAQSANSNAQLTSILEMTNQAYVEGLFLGEQTATMYGTLSARLQMFRNLVHEAGVSFGQAFLPALKQAVEWASRFVLGIINLPGPMKLVIAALGGLVTVFSAALAIVTLFGPRVAIATGALLHLIGVMGGSAASAEKLKSKMHELGFSFGKVDTEVRQSVGGMMMAQSQAEQIQHALLRLANAIDRVSNSFANLTLRVRTASAAMGEKIRSALGLARAEDIVEKEVNDVTIAMHRQQSASVSSGTAISGAGAAAAGATSLFARFRGIVAGLGKTFLFLLPLLLAFQQIWSRGGGEQKRIEAQQKLGDTTKQLAAYLARSNDLSREQARLFLQGKVRTEELSESMKKYGEFSGSAAKNIQAAAEAFGVSAGALASAVFADAQAELEAIGIGSERAARGTIDLGDSAEETARKVRAERDALRELANLLEQIAQAHIDIVEAEIRQREAALAVAQAQERYNEALAATKDRTEAIRRAEHDLQQAQMAREQSILRLQEAQYQLSIARTLATERVAEAEDALADSQDRLLRSQQNVLDIEQEIAELRAGPTMEEILRATNKLRDAQLSLVRSTQSVSDAQWLLNHLRQEGAGARDIREAEMKLEEARLSVSDSQLDLIESERELAELRDETLRQQRINELERELAAARRDVDEATRAIAKAERELQIARDRLKNDSDYKEAELALGQARLSLKDQTNAVRDAENALARARSGNDAARALEEAEIALERAYLNSAEAAVEVQRQTALMAGQNWDAGDSARALAQELDKIGDSINIEPVRKRIEEISEALMNAPSVPEVPEAFSDAGEDAAGNFADSFGDEMGDAIPLALDGIGQTAVQKLLGDMESSASGGGGKKSIWERLLDPQRFIVGGGVGSAVGAIVGAIVGAFGGPIGIAAGAFIGQWVGSIVAIFWEEITAGIGWVAKNIPKHGGKIIQGLWDGIVELGKDLFWNWPKRLIGWIVDPLLNTFRMRSPSRLMADMGKNIIRGLLNGIKEVGRDVLQWFRDLPGKIVSALGSFASTVSRFFRENNPIKILGEFLSDRWKSVREWLKELPGKITGAIGDLGGAVGKVLNPIKNAFKKPFEWVWDKILSPFFDVIMKIADVIPDVDFKKPAKPKFGTVEEHHRGGVAGKGKKKRRLDSLRPGEVPAVLQSGEGIISRRGMRLLPEGYLDALNKGRAPETGGPSLKDVANAVGGAGGWIRDRAGDAVSFVVEKFREAAAWGLERLVGPIKSAIQKAGSLFGFPGEMLAGLMTTPVDRAIEWIRGAQKDTEGMFKIGSGLHYGMGASASGPLIDFLKSSGFKYGRDFRVTSVWRPTDLDSLHSKRKAVDFGNPGGPGILTPGLKKIFDAFARVKDQLYELIYAGADWNILRGRVVPIHKVRPTLQMSHLDHVHAALADQGRVIPPGLSMILNKTGLPEYLLPNDLVRGMIMKDDMMRMLSALERDPVVSGGDTFNFNMIPTATAHEVVREVFWQKKITSRG